MTINPFHQQAFFDESAHRFAVERLLNPTKAQIWEYNQLLAPLKNKNPAKTTIVDMGSGAGRLTFELLKRGFTVIAYDISRQSLKNLREIYQKNCQPGWGSLTITHTLPPPHSAEAIVGCDILHHVPLSTTLIEWRRLLKPNGLALFSEPNAFYLLWYLHFMFHGVPWHIEQGILQCRPNNLKNLFLAAGFKNCQIFGHGLLPTPFPLPTPLAKNNALTWARNFAPLAFRLQIEAS